MSEAISVKAPEAKSPTPSLRESLWGIWNSTKIQNPHKGCSDTTFLIYNRHLPNSLRSVGNLHQILKLSLNPCTNKTRGKTSAGQAVRRLALMGRAVSEDCQAVSATLLHPVNPLPSITRSARLIPLPRAARCKSPLGCLLIAHEVWWLSSSPPGNFGNKRTLLPNLYNSTHHQKSGKCEILTQNWPDYVKITPQNSTDYVKSAY